MKKEFFLQNSAE